MLKSNLSKQAAKTLSKLPLKQAKQIARKISQLQLNPKPQDTKKLINSDYLRVDSGEYRIIYLINNEQNSLDILLIDKRNDGEVYKHFKNLIK